MLNSFLQFLEESNSTDSLVIATTNHPELLDRALFRRFDDILEYSLPDSDGIKAVLNTYLHAYITKRIAWTKIVEAANGLSQAELSRAASEVVKEMILSGSKQASVEAITATLKERHALRDAISGLTPA